MTNLCKLILHETILIIPVLMNCGEYITRLVTLSEMLMNFGGKNIRKMVNSSEVLMNCGEYITRMLMNFGRKYIRKMVT